MDLFQQLKFGFDFIILDQFKHQVISKFYFFRVQSISLDSASWLQIKQVKVLFVAPKNCVAFVEPWRHFSFVELLAWAFDIVG